MTRILLFSFYVLSMLILPDARGELLVSWTNLERGNDGVLEAAIATNATPAKITASASRPGAGFKAQREASKPPKGMTRIPVQLNSAERGQDLRGQTITAALGANQTIELQIEVAAFDELEAGAFLELSHLTWTGRALRRGRAVGPQRFQVALDGTLTGTPQKVSANVFERHRVELGHAITKHGTLALQLIFAGTAPSAERDAADANAAKAPLKNQELSLQISSIELHGRIRFPVPDYHDRKRFPDGPVSAVLQQHCVKCHGPDKQKGEVRFDTLSRDMLADRAALNTWHDALDAVHRGEMPPEKEAPLPSTGRAILSDFIRGGLAEAARSIQPDGPVIRRLNRAEYQYTMTDLLGFEMDYAGNLPPDPISADGFLNNGAALGMSSMQLENYLATARQALDIVLVDGEAPSRRATELKPVTRRKRLPPGFTGNKSTRLGRVNYWQGTCNDMPQSGKFTVRVTAQVEPGIDDGRPALAPVLDARYGFTVDGLTVSFYEELGRLELQDMGGTNVFEFSGHAEFFPMPSGPVPPEKLHAIVLLSNGLDDGQPDPKAIKEKKKPTRYPEDPAFPKIVIERVEFVVNDYPSWPPALHRKIVPEASPLAESETVAEVLAAFLKRAWRRPLNESEHSKWLDHYESIRAQTGSDIQALRETLAAALISPHFLYLEEPDVDAASGQPKQKESRPLRPHELANRLSYFLWSSMPDTELTRLADEGSLVKPAVLQRTVERMLADPRSERFVNQFTSQWLDLGALDRVAVNPQYYRTFDDALKPMMAAETRLFFQEILRNDHSALNFLQSNWTMLNGPLARHYQLKDREGEGLPRTHSFERVSLAGTTGTTEANNRPGGLLGHASMHLGGSDGVDSHPIKRAVWIRERLLHDPPDPPPPDVPDIEESVPGFDKLSIREQLAVHREKDACNDCHRGIDPWGIALEHYDAVGLFRERNAKNKKTIDATTRLPGTRGKAGPEIAGLGDIQDHLFNERAEDFAHALTSKLLTYALGRSLGFADGPTVDDLAEGFVEDGYVLRSLLRDIVLSETFRTR